MPKECSGSFALAVAYAEEVEVLVPRNDKDVGTHENEGDRAKFAGLRSGYVCTRVHCIWRGRWGLCSEWRKGKRVWDVQSGIHSADRRRRTGEST
jgi:hypothetical protein